MSLQNPEIKALSTVLHTSDAEKRLVIYHAIAEVLAGNLVKTVEAQVKDYELKMRVSIKNIVDAVGEIAIIDRSLFENALVSVVKYKLYKPNPEELRTELYNENANFFSVIGLTRFYSQVDIEYINKNFSLYRSTIITTLNAAKHLSSSDV